MNEIFKKKRTCLGNVNQIFSLTSTSVKNIFSSLTGAVALKSASRWRSRSPLSLDYQAPSILLHDSFETLAYLPAVSIWALTSDVLLSAKSRAESFMHRPTRHLSCKPVPTHS